MNSNSDTTRISQVNNPSSYFSRNTDSSVKVDTSDTDSLSESSSASQTNILAILRPNGVLKNASPFNLSLTKNESNENFDNSKMHSYENYNPPELQSLRKTEIILPLSSNLGIINESNNLSYINSAYTDCNKLSFECNSTPISSNIYHNEAAETRNFSVAQEAMIDQNCNNINKSLRSVPSLMIPFPDALKVSNDTQTFKSSIENNESESNVSYPFDSAASRTIFRKSLFRFLGNSDSEMSDLDNSRNGISSLDNSRNGYYHSPRL